MIKNLVIAILIMVSGTLLGQTNLALTATASASASSSGNYGPGNWNDGQIGPQYYFGWLGTASNFPQPAYIQYEWSSAQTFNQLKFYPPTWSQPGYVYFQGSAQIQYWNGNAWVTHHSFNSGPTNAPDTVNFQTITTSKVRVTNFIITGADNPGWDEIEVYHIASHDLEAYSAGYFGGSGFTYNGTPQNHIIAIVNLGNVIETQFQVGFYSNCHGLITETINDSIYPSDTIWYSFNHKLTYEEGGSMDFVYFTMLSSDNNKNNDTTLFTINVAGAANDFGVSSAVSPADTVAVNSQTSVSVYVKNFTLNNSKTDIELGYQYGNTTVYDTLKTTVNSNDSVLFTFPQQITINSMGVNNLKVFTNHCSDNDNLNDTLHLQIIGYNIGMNEKAGQSFKVYPNPTNDYIQIEGLKDSKNTYIEIFDIYRLVSRTKPSSTKKIIVDLSGLQNGVYFIRINDTVKKIIKQ